MAAPIKKILQFRRDLQDHSAALDAEAFLSKRQQDRDAGGAHSDGTGSAAEATPQDSEPPHVSTAPRDVPGHLCLPSGPLTHLELRAHAVSHLSEQAKTWLHIDSYATMLSLDTTREEHLLKEKGSTGVKFYATQVYDFMAEPSSSKGAFWWSVTMLMVILLSTISFVLATVGPLYDQSGDVFDQIEMACVIIFTVDYGVRWITCPMAKWRFMLMPFNIIDLISILPWYIGLILNSDSANMTSVFRVLRLLRVFRILRMHPRLSGVTVVADTLQSSTDILLIMLFFVLLLLILFSTIMYILERGNWDDTLGYYVRTREYIFLTDDDGNSVPQPSPYTSIPQSFWWTIVTMLTVGYGDVAPVTVGGKAVAMVVMLCGILTLALPIGVLGTTFTTLWLEHKDQQSRGLKPMPPCLQQLDTYLTEHTTNIEDLVKMYSLVEREVDTLRGQLHDKVVAWRKSDLAAATIASRLKESLPTNNTVKPGAAISQDASATGSEDTPAHIRQLRGPSRNQSMQVVRSLIMQEAAFQAQQHHHTSAWATLNEADDLEPRIPAHHGPSMPLHPQQHSRQSSPTAAHSQQDEYTHGQGASTSSPAALQSVDTRDPEPVDSGSSDRGPVPVAEAQEDESGLSASSGSQTSQQPPAGKAAWTEDASTPPPQQQQQQQQQQTPLLEHIENLLGQQVRPAAQDKELQAILELEKQLQEKMSYLHDLLKATSLLRAHHLPEQIKDLRFMYGEVQTTQQTHKELKHTLARAEQELVQLELALANLQTREHITSAGPTMQPKSAHEHAAHMASTSLVVDASQGSHAAHVRAAGNSARFLAILQNSRLNRVTPTIDNSLPSRSSVASPASLMNLAAQLAQDKDGAAALAAAAQRVTRLRMNSTTGSSAPDIAGFGTQ